MAPPTASGAIDARVPRGRSAHRRAAWAAVAIGVISAASLAFIDDPVISRATVIAGMYLVLALTEVVPPFVPTMLLLAATPLLLGPLGPHYRLSEVLSWPANPVLALFVGGLALGLAAERHRIDAAIADRIVRLSRGDRRGLLAFVLLGTATMSMWMSNVAAAVMMLAALRPLLRREAPQDPFRRAVLLSIAVGANLGGMATPIGTGPNALAIAAAAERRSITFIGWMAFGVPLVIAMLAVALVLLVLRYRVRGSFQRVEPVIGAKSDKAAFVVVVFVLAVAAWITEPLHGVSAALVALVTATALFGSGILGKEDLGALDWSTLGLVAGGISLGELIERTGLLARFAQQIEWSAYPQIAWLGGLLLVSALLSSLMSNTATAALLIPLGMMLDPSPAIAVLIAIAASFGMPFTISTPPNAMVYGEGGLTTGDLLWIGLPLMIIGLGLVSLTGLPVLRFLGVP
jgi:solute carrier family 13 (sodium-dependent dicarboxylate transporter), member 2/3/5